jgi:hypothetical protein
MRTDSTYDHLTDVSFAFKAADHCFKRCWWKMWTSINGGTAAECGSAVDR